MAIIPDEDRVIYPLNTSYGSYTLIIGNGITVRSSYCVVVGDLNKDKIKDNVDMQWLVDYSSPDLPDGVKQMLMEYESSTRIGSEADTKESRQRLIERIGKLIFYTNK